MFIVESGNRRNEKQGISYLKFCDDRIINIMKSKLINYIFLDYIDVIIGFFAGRTEKHLLINF
jgi:hypothetical protein